MNEFVLDTNIVSYGFKRHSFYDFYEPLLSNATCYISFMTVAEILEGAHRANWGPTLRAKMDFTLGRFIVIESSRLICENFAAIRYHRRQQPIEPADAFIAATAIAYDIPLVTHNAKDFVNIPDLRVVST